MLQTTCFKTLGKMRPGEVIWHTYNGKATSICNIHWIRPENTKAPDSPWKEGEGVIGKSRSMSDIYIQNSSRETQLVDCQLSIVNTQDLRLKKKLLFPIEICPSEELQYNPTKKSLLRALTLRNLLWKVFDAISSQSSAVWILWYMCGLWIPVVSFKQKNIARIVNAVQCHN